MHSVAVCVLYVAALVGQTTLSRIDPEYSTLGWLGEPRILLVGLLVILTIPFIGKHKEGLEPEYRFARRWVVLVLLFHAYMALSYLWSPRSANSKETVLSIIILLMILYAAYILVSYDPYKTIRLFLYLFVISAVIYTIVGFWNLIAAQSFFRLRFLWGGPNVFIRVVGAGTIALLYFWTKTKRKVWLLSIPILLLASLLSGSRGGVVSLVITLMLSLVFIIKDFRKVIVFVLIALIVVVLLFTPMASTFADYIKGRYLVSLKKFNAVYERSRGSVFSSSWKVFADSPWLGKGIGGIPFYAGHVYSHNIVLETAADGGLLGLLFLALLLVPLIRRWFRNREIETNICLVLAVFYLLTNLVSGTYYDWRYMWLFFLFYMMPIIGRNELGDEGSFPTEGVDCN